MTELTELERLEKAEADAYAAIICTDIDLDDDHAGRAYAVWVKAKLELKDYLKEQDNEG